MIASSKKFGRNWLSHLSTPRPRLVGLKSSYRSSGSYASDNFIVTANSLFHDKIRRSHEPVPYSSSIILPENSFPASSKSEVKKVSVIGCGQVGLACAYAMLNQEIPGAMALVDMNGEKLAGEAKDMNQGSAFHSRVDISASTDFTVTAGSNLVMITAGAAQNPGESRLSLVGRNVAIMKDIIPRVLEHSPDAAIFILANPCDIMTAVAAKIAGPNVPPGRIFGAGTLLDSGRLSTIVANSLDIETSSVHGFVIGEHGDSSVPVWSSFRVGGIPLLPPGQDPTETHMSMHKEVVNSAYDVIEKKGYTNWAIGMSSAVVAKAVVNDYRSIMPVATCVRGFLGIQEDVFMSVPCVVGSPGITRVAEIPLSEAEAEMFRISAKNLWEVQKGVWDDI